MTSFSSCSGVFVAVVVVVVVVVVAVTFASTEGVPVSAVTVAVVVGGVAEEEEGAMAAVHLLSDAMLCYHVIILQFYRSMEKYLLLYILINFMVGGGMRARQLRSFACLVVFVVCSFRC